MWRIGGLKIDSRVVLGPMAGYTFGSYRRFMHRFGVGLSFTEMTSANGIVHDQERSGAFVNFDDPGPTGLQLFGDDPEVMAEASVASLERNPSIRLLDVNMGCPMYKVTRSGSGSALMKDPALCGRIIGAMKDVADVPVTAKMRLGWGPESINFREVLEEVVSNGADAVTVHARTMKDRYAGAPRYDLLSGLGEELPVPLIVSGNIFSPEDAARALGSTGADAVMVAMGGIGNPFLVTQIRDLLETGMRRPDPTVSQQVSWCKELAGLMADDMGEELAMKRIRSIAPKFIAGLENCHGYRLALAHDPSTMEQLFRMLDELDSRIGGQRIMSYGRPMPETAVQGPPPTPSVTGLH